MFGEGLGLGLGRFRSRADFVHSDSFDFSGSCS